MQGRGFCRRETSARRSVHHLAKESFLMDETSLEPRAASSAFGVRGGLARVAGVQAVPSLARSKRLPEASAAKVRLAWTPGQRRNEGRLGSAGVLFGLGLGLGLKFQLGLQHFNTARVAGTPLRAFWVMGETGKPH